MSMVGQRILSPGPSWTVLSAQNSSPALSSETDSEAEDDELTSSTSIPRSGSFCCLERSTAQTSLNFIAKKRMRGTDGADAATREPKKLRIATKSVPFRITRDIPMSSKDRELIWSPPTPKFTRKKPPLSSARRQSQNSSLWLPPLDQAAMRSKPRNSSLGDTNNKSKSTPSTTPKSGKKRASGYGISRGSIQTPQTRTEFLGCIDIASSSEEDCGMVSSTHKTPDGLRGGTTSVEVIELSSDTEQEEALEARTPPVRQHRRRLASPKLIRKPAEAPTLNSSAPSRKSYLFLESSDDSGTDSSNVYIWDVDIAGTRSDFNFDAFPKPTRRDAGKRLAPGVWEARSNASESSEPQSPVSSFKPQTPTTFAKSCAFFGHSMPSHTQPQASSSSSSFSCPSRPASSDRRSAATRKQVNDFLQSCVPKPPLRPRKTV